MRLYNYESKKQIKTVFEETKDKTNLSLEMS